MTTRAAAGPSPGVDAVEPEGAAGTGVPQVVLVMGICGTGKTTVGRGVAEALDGVFLEGDEFHSAHNRAKMAAGTPLDDDDRRGWLAAINAEMRRRLEHDPPTAPIVVACSALKAIYRTAVLDHIPAALIAHLHLTEAVALTRVAQRRNHFMPASLVASQLHTLQPPEPAEGWPLLTLDVGETQAAACVARVVEAYRSCAS